MIDVLFLPKWYPNRLDPFDGNFVENHAHAIKRKAKISVIFVHSDKLKRGYYEIESKDNKGIRECRVYFQKATSPISILNKITNFLRYRKAQNIAYKTLYESSQPDLVHIHVLSRPGLLAYKLWKRLNIPYVITEHWSGYLPSSNKYKGVIKKSFSKKIVANAKAVHTVSTHLAKAMQNHRLYNTYKVIPNVVDEKLFLKKTKENQRTKILFVGNLLQSPKRILDIIRAVHSLSKKGEDFELHIFGEGSDESKAKSLSRQLGMEKQIHFQGTTNRQGIAKVMAASDFLILFSEFENQPCVIAEAQSCGLPVIVPDLPGIVEFMKPELGRIVKRGKQNDFEEALLEMCRNYKSYDAEKIRSYAIATFGEKSIADQFNRFYQIALNG